MIAVICETETHNGWEFDLETLDECGGRIVFQLRLAWVDYNHWSRDGAARPADVAAAVMRFLLDREPALEIAGEFDAARVRRRYSDADEVIPSLIA